jgi:hypothetical protein
MQGYTGDVAMLQTKEVISFESAGEENNAGDVYACWKHILVRMMWLFANVRSCDLFQTIVRHCQLSPYHMCWCVMMTFPCFFQAVVLVLLSARASYHTGTSTNLETRPHMCTYSPLEMIMLATCMHAGRIYWS